MVRPGLPAIVERLAKLHGRPPPPLRDPWLLILRENVAYLAADARRDAAFETLERKVGTTPKEIFAASDAALREVASHGILAETFVEKLRRCADLVLHDTAFAELDEKARRAGDLSALLRWPAPKAKKALTKFPGIGEPGAEKILLFARAHPTLALESNGLRVLVRLGFATEQKSYSTTYRLVREAVEADLAASRKSASLASNYDFLIAAHLLLRRHGQELCKHSAPKCVACPLKSDCPHGTALETARG
jgi:endonuclease-3